VRGLLTLRSATQRASMSGIGMFMAEPADQGGPMNCRVDPEVAPVGETSVDETSVDETSVDETFARHDAIDEHDAPEDR